MIIFDTNGTYVTIQNTDDPHPLTGRAEIWDFADFWYHPITCCIGEILNALPDDVKQQMWDAYINYNEPE